MRKMKGGIKLNLILSAALALSLGLFPALLSGAQKGANVIVRLKEGPPAIGELIAVKQDSLIVLGDSFMEMNIDFQGIESVQIVRKSQLGAGLGIGFAAGLLISGGYVATQDPHAGKGEMFGGLGNAMSNASNAAIIVGITTLLGAVGGLGAGTDENILIEAVSPDILKANLEELRMEARMPNAQ